MNADSVAQEQLSGHGWVCRELGSCGVIYFLNDKLQLILVHPLIERLEKALGQSVTLN